MKEDLQRILRELGEIKGDALKKMKEAVEISQGIYEQNYELVKENKALKAKLRKCNCK